MYTSLYAFGDAKIDTYIGYSGLKQKPFYFRTGKRKENMQK